MERPSQAEWGAWKSDLTTQAVLKFLLSMEVDIVEGLISGAYKTYSEVERARGTIEGLRMVHDMPRGEVH
jgi:hypothetical protein